AKRRYFAVLKFGALVELRLECVGRMVPDEIVELTPTFGDARCCCDCFDHAPRVATGRGLVTALVAAPLVMLTHLCDITAPRTPTTAVATCSARPAPSCPRSTCGRCR